MSSLLAAIICCLSPHPIFPTTVFLLLWLRGSSLLMASSILLQLNLDPTVSAFGHGAWSVTHTEGMQLPEQVTFRRYQKCWGRAGITRQSSSDFVRMRFCQDEILSPTGKQPGLSAEHFLFAIWLCSWHKAGWPNVSPVRAEGPSPGSGPHLCFPVQWLYWAHRILFDSPPAAATKRVGGLLSLLSKSLSKINKATNAFWFKYSCKHIYATACRIWLSNRIPWAKASIQLPSKNKWEDPYVSLKCI